MTETAWPNSPLPALHNKIADAMFQHDGGCLVESPLPAQSYTKLTILWLWMNVHVRILLCQRFIIRLLMLCLGISEGAFSLTSTAIHTNWQYCWIWIKVPGRIHLCQHFTIRLLMLCFSMTGGAWLNLLYQHSHTQYWQYCWIWIDVRGQISFASTST